MSKPLKCEIKLQKDFEKTQSSHFTKLYLNVFNENFSVGKKERKRRAVINSILLNFHGN